MLTLKCPSCKAESKLSLVGGKYEGPFRCYKCHGLFSLKVENNQLVSLQPITKEEMDRQEQERKRQEDIEALKRKFRHDQPG